ncbi:CRE-LEM-3 protein [Aphelenchoides avenae]|nr:CRE-LEM-3 protein [Aphelenchus avenae]
MVFRRLQAEVDVLRNQLNLSRAQTTAVLSTLGSREAEIEEDQWRFRQIKATLQENRENLGPPSALTDLLALVESAAERVPPPKPNEARHESKSPRTGCPLSPQQTPSTPTIAFKRDSETCSALLDTDFDSTQASSPRPSLFSSRASIRLSGVSVSAQHSRSTTPESDVGASEVAESDIGASDVAESDVGASDVQPPSSPWVTMRAVRLATEPPANHSKSTGLSVTLPTAVVAPLRAPTSTDQRDPAMRSSLLTPDSESARVMNSQQRKCSTQASARTSNESESTHNEKPASLAATGETAVLTSPSLAAMQHALLADAQQSPLGSIENRHSDPALPIASEMPASAVKEYREKRSSLLTSDAESTRELNSRQSQCSTRASARTSNESASTRYATADEAGAEEATPSRSAMERTLLADAQRSPSAANDPCPSVDALAPAALETLETLTMDDNLSHEPRSSLLTSDAESAREPNSRQSQCSTQASARTSNESASTRYATADEAEAEETTPSKSAMESTLLADAHQSPSGANHAGPSVHAPDILQALETLTIDAKRSPIEPRSSLLTSDAESVRLLNSQQSQYSTQPNSQSSSGSGPTGRATPESEEEAVGDAEEEKEEPEPSPREPSQADSLLDRSVPGPSTSTPIRRTPLSNLSEGSFNSTPRAASMRRNLRPLLDDPSTPLTPVPAEKAAQLRSKVSRFDVATLRSRLREYNVDVGPINAINRSLYEKKLVAIEVSEEKERATDKYSSSLERMIRYEEQGVPANIGDKEERQLRLEFAVSSPKNNEVSFFCYLLIDPTLLPEGSQCTFRRFVAAIFYVGKGNRSRPLQHLKDASKCRASVDRGLIQPSEKLRQIISLWNGGHGVISLHVCFNIHSAEAFIREGAMIESIGVANLTNVKHGEFRQCARNWHRRQITDFGALCLKKAYAVFQNERCRPIFEADLN